MINNGKICEGYQLRLPISHEGDLQKRIVDYVGFPIDLTITNNSSIMMNYILGENGDSDRLRLHHMFKSASQEVVEALSSWILLSKNRDAGNILDRFIEANQYLVQLSTKIDIKLNTQGIYHDLRELYDVVNEKEFGNSVGSPIIWGRNPPKKRRKSIRLGSYTPEDNIIRVHPYLDQEFVPEFFVKYIVFNEMLHSSLGFEEVNGRRIVHTLEFYEREKQYEDYERSVVWHNNPQKLGRLLRKVI